jgi:cephalosporin hydroxylase
VGERHEVEHLAEVLSLHHEVQLEEWASTSSSRTRVADLYDGGPLRAIHEFLARTNGRYEIDRTLCDTFGTNVTWNVDGYLRRVG